MKKSILMLTSLLAASANAGAISSAVSVSNAPHPIQDWSFDRTIDQSGLSVGYTSGITDFDAYVASSPMHVAVNIPANYGVSFTLPPVVVDYDLGEAVTTSRLAFWNYPHLDAGIVNFNVYTSTEAGFGASTLVGSFLAIDDGSGLGLPGNSVQVFDLVDTTGRFIRIDVISTNGNGTGWSEVAFDVVPEPATITLLALGGIAALKTGRAFGHHRRR